MLTDLKIIARIAAEKEDENDDFRSFLKQQDGEEIDAIVHKINDIVTAQIDCTLCGNCCKSLMINVTTEESVSLANHLKMDVEAVKEKYLEESHEGKMIINTIPCHFLGGSICIIYENRFNECREFPHLHKKGFTTRLFGTLMNYAICPIIFNVVENLKVELDYQP